MFYYARYHFKKHGQVYELENDNEDFLILPSSWKH